MKEDHQFNRIILFCFIAITSINLMVGKVLDFVFYMNWTILILLSLFWVIMETYLLKKQIKEKK